MTFGDVDGHSCEPPSPDDAKKLTPLWLKWPSYKFSLLNSEAPQLFETYWAWAFA